MKKHESRSWFCVACTLCLALGYAVVAPLGCGTSGVCADAPHKITCDTVGPGGASGTGGLGGGGGNSGTGGNTGGSAGTSGSAGTGGGAGSGGGAGTGGGAGSGGGAGTGGSAGTGSDSGIICGGIAGLPCPEPSTMFCDYPGCGGRDQTGVCRPRPAMCSRDCPGACGCDGKPYCNVCEGQRAGTDAVTGPCPDASNLQRAR